MVGTTPVGVPMTGVAGIPVDATAVVVNTEVSNPSNPGYVRVTPFGTDATVAVQEFAAHQTISNLVTAQLASGKVQVKVSAGSARVLMDVSGYYSPSSTNLFSAMNTTRMFDATVGTTPIGVTIAGLSGIPADATAVVVNTEVSSPGAGGYVRVTPFGSDPSVAVQEFVAGQTISNLGIVKLSSGKLQVKVSAASARILMDVSGYYRSAGSSFVPLPTTRVFDGTISTNPHQIQMGGMGGIDANASAVVVNTEVFQPSSTGYVRVTPAGSDPSVAVQEFTAGTSISNLVIVKLVGGKLQAKVSAGSARVLMDVAGYYGAVPSASITGTVVSSTGAAPLSGVGVSAYDPAGNQVAKMSSAANGTFSLPLVPNQTGYSVCFDGSTATGGPSANGYESECYPNTSWNLTELPTGTTQIPLSSGQTYPLGTVSLDSGASLSGKITAAMGGAGLGNVDVFLFGVANGGVATNFGMATTASDGTYSVKGVFPSMAGYNVCFDATHAAGGASPAGYLSACYGSASPWKLNAFGGAGASPVSVAPGQAVTAIDDALSTAAGVSGTVTASGSGGLSGVNVLVYSVDSGFLATGFGTATTGAGGTYIVKNLIPEPGGYNVCFDPAGVSSSSPTGYQPQCYNNAAWDGGTVPSTAAVVSSASGLASGINATLATGASISGTVSAATGGALLQNVAVDVYRSDGTFLTTVHTASNGTYTVPGLGLTGAGYFVCFDATNAVVAAGSNGYLDQCWHNVAWRVGDDPTVGTPVATPSAANVANINAQLASSSSIGGAVTNSAAGIANVSVSLWRVGPFFSTQIADKSTNASGAYKFTDVAAGSYQVCFDATNATGGPSTTGYQSQCYNGASWDPASFSPADSATPVGVAAGATVTVNAALPSGGAVAGSVTAAGSGAALGHVLVTLTSSTATASVLTAANGTYRISSLVPGAYVVCFDASSAVGGTSTRGYLSMCFNSSTPVTVTAGNTATANQALAIAGAVMGTVTAATGGAPLSGVNVLVFDLATSSLATQFSTATAADGTYSVVGLPTGTYQVCFDAGRSAGGSSTTGYLNQCYSNVAWPDQFSIPAAATHVSVTAAATTSGVNASLTTASAIGGTVAASDGGAMLGGVFVSVFDSGGNFIDGTLSLGSGVYRVNGLPPDATGYTVCFTPDFPGPTGGTSPGGYLRQCYQNVVWDGSTPPPAGTPVITTSGNVTTANAALAAAGGIKGKVIAATGGAPLANVFVEVFTPGGVLVGGGSTIPAGTNAGGFIVQQLPVSATGYVVCFDGSAASGGTSVTGYESECYNNVPWDGSSTPPGGTTNVAIPTTALAVLPTVSLATAPGIAGHVTDIAGPVANVQVTLYDGSGSFVNTTSTSSNGAYVFPALSAGTYYVCFDAKNGNGSSTVGYLDQCWNNKLWDGDLSPTDPSISATAINLTTTPVTNVDAHLLKSGAISGTVTEAAGPVNGAFVEVINSLGVEVGNAFTAADGTYVVKGLTSGSYSVCFDGTSPKGPSPSGYLLQCFANQPWDGGTVPGGVTSVSVTLAANHSGINATLQRAGAISGTVTDASPGPVSAVSVEVFDAAGQLVRIGLTGADGTYIVPGIQSAGNYFVCFDASFASGSSSTGYLDQCYNNQSWDGFTSPGTPTDTQVPVTLAGTHSGVNAVLQPGASISGTVSSGGNGVDLVLVKLYDASDNLVESVYSAFDGTYSFQGLSTGSYQVCFDGSQATDVSPTGYVDQCYNAKAWNGLDTPSSSGATSVPTTAGHVTANIDASMSAAGAISGTVVDSASGNPPITGATVEVFSSTGKLLGSTITLGDGTYQINGVPAASNEFVCFDGSFASSSASGGPFLDQCYNGHSWDGAMPVTATHDAVVVTAGNVTTSIDATLTAGP